MQQNFLTWAYRNYEQCLEREKLKRSVYLDRNYKNYIRRNSNLTLRGF